MPAKVPADVALFTAIVVPVMRGKDVVGLLMSPIGMVEEKGKMQIIHDFNL